LAIPIDGLISIQAKEKGHVVRYHWRGKEMTSKGRLLPGKLTGKSDFGDWELDIADVKRLAFNRPSAMEKSENKVRHPAVLTLHDGRKVDIDGLKRYDSYYSSDGYVIGGRMRYNHYTDLRLLRGESLVTVEFEKIARIEFNGEKDISVTLKSGKKATGQIAKKKDAGIVGFTGVFDKGVFFISRKFVKEIAFVSGE
jgi:hypothetical protein